MTCEVRLLNAPFDAAEQLQRFNQVAEGAGGIVTFTGLARYTVYDGSQLAASVLESYRTVTLRSMEEIARAAHDRFGIALSLVLHRVGRIAPGEPIVFVAAAAPHRRAAFEAADYMMEWLKSEAVFCKREEGPEGTAWI